MGRIDVTVLNGTLFGVDPASVDLQLGHGNGSEIGSDTRSASITDVEIVTPESPTGLLTLLGGFGILVRRARFARGFDVNS